MMLLSTIRNYMKVTKMATKGHYQIGVCCYNCWVKDKIEIEKGKTLEPYRDVFFGLGFKKESHIGEETIKCKNCGMARLHIWTS